MTLEKPGAVSYTHLDVYKRQDFKLCNAAEILRTQQIDLDTGNYLKLLPHLHHTDGFFAAVFEKNDANLPVKNDDKLQPEEVTAKKTAAKTKAKKLN